MCVDWQSVENPYTHKVIRKECGKCYSCLEKKNKRRERLIREHHEGPSSKFLTLFVTLNYSNDYVPFIKLSDIDKIKKDPLSNKFCLPVYRHRTVVGHYYNRHKKKYYLKVDKNEQILTHLSPLESHKLFYRYDNSLQKKPLTPLTNDKTLNRIGVCFNADFSSFIKRLRSFLSYKELPKIYSYYKVSEYGPTTSRPHFHAEITFLTTKKDSFKTFSALRSAIVSCWQYSSYYQRFRNVEIARNPAAYISRYVSRGVDMPDILLFKKFKTSASHSLHYGFSYDMLPENFYNNFKNGLFTYNRCFFDAKKQQNVVHEYAYPSYVYYRYLPKPKGFRFVSYAQLFDVLTFSQTGRNILHSAGNSSYEIECFRRRVNRAFLLFSHVIPNIYDYIIFYIQYYSRLFSFNIQHQHDVFSTGSLFDIYSYMPADYGAKSLLYLQMFSPFVNMNLSCIVEGESLDTNSLFSVIDETQRLSSDYLSHQKKAKDRYNIYQFSHYNSDTYISKSFKSKQIIYGKHFQKTHK